MEGGGYSLVVGSNGYVPLDGVAFSGLTIMGLHFYKSYQNGVAHFQDFQWGSENSGTTLNLTNVSVKFQDDLLYLKGFIR